LPDWSGNELRFVLFATPVCWRASYQANAPDGTAIGGLLGAGHWLAGDMVPPVCAYQLCV
jgi:hypothetical protein